MAVKINCFDITKLSRPKILKTAGVIFLTAAIFLFCSTKIVRAASDLIINEIMYDLAGIDDKHEWIELYNAGSSDIDLTGWKINDGDNATNHAFNAPPKNNSRGSMILPPGGYALLSGDATTLAADLPNYAGTIIDTVLTLSNASATLKIITPDGQEAATVSYSKDLGAAGDGKTLEWNGTQFRESLIEGGTPGSANGILNQPGLAGSPSPLPSPVSSAQPSALVSPSVLASTTPTPAPFYQYSQDVFINEFMPYPLAGEKEWIELLNNGDQPVNLTGWSIGDQSSADHEQLIPDNTIIRPKDFLIINLEKNILNNDGDQVRLIWPDQQVVQIISFGRAQEGLASARLNDRLWVWTNQPTPGVANKKSLSMATTTLLPETAPPQIITKNEAISRAEPTINSKPNPELLTDAKIASSPIINASPSSLALMAASQTAANNSSLKTVFWLIVILALAALAALALIYFRRRKQSPANAKAVDEKNNFPKF